ncbi:TIGR03621 family F420-dependent LLM class oxidoreductase [Nocardia sp. CA-135953]|uniref:TIGR03621 family F420-dependent LLM class oxidoreductase n=1 Tax=Nocardia sp. CA-135953 TaxID=3239978 RepID=UPI003D97EB3D
MVHPFRFGLMSRSGNSAKAITDHAKRAEALGYHSLLYNDHYLGPGPAMAEAHHPIQEVAPIPAATLAAAVTDTLVIGFRVLCVDYHNPVVLAKELATLDLLSEGRLDIGLGAGWIAAEYAAMGIAFDRPGVRIARLGETVEVLRACFGEGQVDVRGTHGVHASGFEGVPKPVGNPPITIGGGGPKVLSLAARVADIVAFNINNATGKLGPDGPRSATAALTKEKVDLVRAAAGDRFDDIQLEIGSYFTVVTDDVEGAAAALPAQTGGMLDLPLSELLEHPHVLIGDVSRICDTLVERRERYGFNYVTVREADMESFAPVVERLVGK